MQPHVSVSLWVCLYSDTRTQRCTDPNVHVHAVIATVLSPWRLRRHQNIKGRRVKDLFSVVSCPTPHPTILSSIPCTCLLTRARGMVIIDNFCSVWSGQSRWCRGRCCIEAVFRFVSRPISSRSTSVLLQRGLFLINLWFCAKLFFNH